MNTKNNLLSKTFTRLFLSVFTVATLLLVGCSNDPEPTNEEEVITTVTVTLTPAGGGGVVTLTWDDTNLNGVVDASEIEAGTLSTATTYTASIQLLNKSVTPTEDITEEIEEEANDHLFCFAATGVAITFSNFDKDENNLPVGLTSTWTTTTAGRGSVNIKLRHQPGVKTGECPGGGDTDIDITFPIEIIALPD